MMRYLSVCSGIEAASAAWHPLGWKPFAFAEIEKFPSRVLAHHYPHVPNLGDMTKFKEWPDAKIDILVGGTPCQSFSVAGLRKGLDDPRGNLALTYCAILDKYRPRWFVWENVPGVLSTDGGRAFGSILGAMAELGYGFAYRVLDAQYVRVDGFGRAVPQRRRRVFVAGYLGDWRRAAKVLFERESLSGNSAPSRKTRERVADTISACPTGGGGLGTDFDLDGGLIPSVSCPLLAKPNASFDNTLQSYVAFGGNNCSGPLEVATAVNAHGGPAQRLDWETENFVAHSLRAGGFDASEDGTGRGTPLVPVIAFDCKASGQSGFGVGDVASTMRAMGHANGHTNGGGHQAVAYDLRGREGGSQFEGPHETANIRAASGGSSRSYLAQNWAVRRLTPRECERLQGFTDDYTLIPGVADGSRYKALGNSMAVNVMRWIGTRIQMVDAQPSMISPPPYRYISPLPLPPYRVSA